MLAQELCLNFLWEMSLLVSLSPSAAICPYCSLLCFPNGPHMGYTHNVVSMSLPFPCIFLAFAPHMAFPLLFAFCRPDGHSI